MEDAAHARIGRRDAPSRVSHQHFPRTQPEVYGWTSVAQHASTTPTYPRVQRGRNGSLRRACRDGTGGGRHGPALSSTIAAAAIVK